MVQKHTVEFNQLAMANSEGSEAMLNRVMTKDNIGVAVLLELKNELMEVSCEYRHNGKKKIVVVQLFSWQLSNLFLPCLFTVMQKMKFK